MKKNTILLVEDDELDVISFERTLKKLDIEYDLYVAHNGKEALNLLTDVTKPIHPEVILLDLNMPKMNGIEFLKALRNEKRFEDLKAIRPLRLFHFQSDSEVVFTRRGNSLLV